MSTEPIAEFFDRECCAGGDVASGPLPSTDELDESLLDALIEAGAVDGTVLELGSGDGTLSRELVRRGAAQVTGLDLSPLSVEQAMAAASQVDLTNQLRYEVGDASTEALVPHDTVVSEKVFCCFPRADVLLANSLPAARSTYALVLPESRGPLGIATRLMITVENGWRRLLRESFRAYVHDVPQIERTIRAAGFRQVISRRHSTWLILVFRRA